MPVNKSPTNIILMFSSVMPVFIQKAENAMIKFITTYQLNLNI